MGSRREIVAPSGPGNTASALGTIEERLGYVLHRTNLVHMDVLRSLLRPIGLTPAGATALAHIHNNPATRQSDLARALGINRASAMEIVSRLEAIEAIERRSGRDRRSNALWLTPKGHEFHERFIAATFELDRLMAADLDGPEREALCRLLRRVRGSLERHLVNAQNPEGEKQK